VIKANFDYELELFSGQSNLKINQEFEYLYWWAEDELSTLSTKLIYSQDYLDYVQSFILNPIEVTNLNPSVNWWGKLTNLKNEKILNSKITSTNFAIEKNLCHPKTQIITDLNQIKDLEEIDYVLKNPNLMSGKGFYKFKGPHFSNQALTWAKKQIITTPIIFEPWLSKKQDFSSYIFFQENRIETYFNFSNEQGNYKGTVVYENPTSTFERLEEIGINLDYYLNFINTVSTFYTELGALDGMSVDSFTYEEEGGNRVYLLSEVNYRKTMGWIALKLKKFLPIDGIGQFYIKKREKQFSNFDSYKKNFSDHLYQKNQKEGILLLSPHQNQFLTFFIVAKTEQQLGYFTSCLDKL
jgi:hypothetical protein